MPSLRFLPRRMRRLPLRGADLVLMARHPLWKGIGLSSNTSLVVECDGPIARERMERALDRLLDVCRWPAARLRRPFPGGKLHGAASDRADAARPPVRRHTVATREDFARALTAELDAPIDPRREPPVRVRLLDPAPGATRLPSFLVLTWFHPFTDARGGQNLLAHLDHLDRHAGESPWNGAPPASFTPPDERPFRVRARIAGESLKHLQSASPEPPVSLGSQVVPPGRIRFRHESFVAPDASGGPRATREITWRLAHVGRAMAELWERR